MTSIPVSERGKPHPRLRIVVLTCGSLGREVALELAKLSGVTVAAVVTAPYAQQSPPLMAKLKRCYVYEGWPGVASALLRRVGARSDDHVGRDLDSINARVDAARIQQASVADLNSPEAVDTIKGYQPDLGVIAGTYILTDPTFSAPRLGCINLHSGKVPEYRGAAPAFWELYNGVDHVGITVHWAVAKVDAGNILRDEIFPLNTRPEGNPLDYLERYRADILRPNLVRLAAEAVAEIQAGRGEGRVQPSSTAGAWRSPTYSNKQELLMRVRERRSAIAGSSP